MRFSKSGSFRGILGRFASAISLQPIANDVAQIKQLMDSLSEDTGGSGSKAVLQRYREYLETGWREGRSPHPLFDEVWYADRYPDVRAAGFPGLVH